MSGGSSVSCRQWNNWRIFSAFAQIGNSLSIPDHQLQSTKTNAHAALLCFLPSTIWPFLVSLKLIEGRKCWASRPDFLVISVIEARWLLSSFPLFFSCSGQSKNKGKKHLVIYLDNNSGSESLSPWKPRFHSVWVIFLCQLQSSTPWWPESWNTRFEHWLSGEKYENTRGVFDASGVRDRTGKHRNVVRSSGGTVENRNVNLINRNYSLGIDSFLSRTKRNAVAQAQLILSEFPNTEGGLTIW